MADKTIGQLPAASQVTPTDLFVLEQSGTAKKLTGQTLENWLLTFADGHGGIQSIEKTGTSGLTDTYTITLSDATTVTLTVHNGKGISSVTTYYAVSSSGSTVPSNWSTTRQSMTATNRYLWSYQRIAFNDNTNTDTAKTVIGVYGDKGDKGDTGDTGNGIASLAQTGRVAGEYTTYTFTMTDGTTESFEAYDGVGITGVHSYYAVSSSGSVSPSNWSQQPPNMTADNRYLWSYQDIRLSNNTGVVTPAVVIGVYGDKGDKGDPGEVTQAEFDDLKNAFITDTEAITGNTPLTFIPGRYLASSGTMKAGLQVSFAENGETPFMCAISPCQPGDKFSAHIVGASGTNRAYLFCDANMKTVAGGWPVANYELNGTRTAPAGAAFVVFNNRMPDLPNGYYAVKGVLLKKVVDDMILEPSGADQTQDIVSKLESDGYCQLGSGDFFVSNIIMPSGSKLCGCGEATRLHFTVGATGNMVTMGDCCTVCDISFYGAEYVNGSGNPISIETAKSTVTVNGDFPGSQIENETAVNLWTDGAVNVDSGIKGIVLATPIEPGTYRVSATLSRSDDSSTNGRIRFSNNASTAVGPSNVIAQAGFYKNERMSATITVEQPIKAVQFISVIGSTTAVSDWENIRITKIDSNKSGICWTGDEVHFGNVHNCRFFYFDVAGILLLDTGTPIDRNLYVSDCFFFKNNVGAYIRKNSEYNKFSNCAFNYNYYGSLNRGGNNYFSNCGFDANYVGCQVDSFEGSNGGHGGISNCSLNHSEPSNTGYGLIVDREEQVIISNCVLGHSNALLNRASGCVLNSCMFIGSITITINKGNSNMLIGNYFQGGNTIVKAIDNTKTKVINCYYFVSGDAVPLVTETT